MVAWKNRRSKCENNDKLDLLLFHWLSSLIGFHESVILRLASSRTELGTSEISTRTKREAQVVLSQD